MSIKSLPPAVVEGGNGNEEINPVFAGQAQTIIQEKGNIKTGYFAIN